MTLSTRLRPIAAITALVALLVVGLGLRPAGAVVFDEFTVGDVALAEGDAGSTSFVFTIGRTMGTGPATVSYGTSSGVASDSATAGTDYTTTAGTASFATNQTSVTVTVPVAGDLTDELDEKFNFTLTPGPTQSCQSGDCVAVGTILNDDGPDIIISNVTLTEGNSGTQTGTFNVDLTGASTHEVRVDYTTQDGTATVADDDYESTSGTLVFAAGDTRKTVAVTINGDTKDEANETFAVVLSNEKHADILDAQGDGRIDNDDTAPTISIADLPTAAESGTAQVPVTLSAASGKTVTVQYTTSNGTAAAGSDYTAATNATITFLPGDTEESAPVAITADATDEDDETFTIALSVPNNATIADGTSTVTIVDDDTAPTISISDAPITEANSGTTDATFTVTLSAASGKTVSVQYATAPGTALATEDYLTRTGTVTFVPGDTSETIAVPVVGDTRNEPTETFVVNLTTPAASTIADDQGTGTITDNDSAPTLSIDDVTHVEGNAGTTSYAFTVSLSAASGQPVTVAFATADATATVAGSDYAANSGTLTFAAGETSKTVTVVANGDTAHEGNETFNVNLTSPSNATVADGQGVGTITNDDPGPVASINDVTVTEGDSGTVTALFTVTLGTASSQTITIDYTTEDGTAVQPEDYTLAAGTLTFNPGETTKTISVAVKGDALPEANEQFSVKLSGPTGGATLGDATGAGTITNDDGTPPALAIVDVTQAETNSGTTTFTFAVNRTGSTTGTVTVDYATAPGTATAPADYTSKSGTLTFGPGITTQNITVSVVGDTTHEPSETFTVDLTNPRNATVSDASGLGTITNDDAVPSITVNDVTLAEGNSGTTTFAFTISLSNPRSTAVSVDVATALGTAQANDLTAVPTTTVTIPAGETTATVNVSVVGDTTDEDAETFFLNLTNANNGDITDAQGTGTISNDDTAPSVSINSPSVAEGNAGPTNLAFTVSLSAASGKTVTVQVTTADGTATAPSDYTAKTQTLTFVPGDTSETFTVVANGDTTFEGSETITATLSDATNVSSTGSAGTGTLTNDDAQPTVSVADASVTEGNSGTSTAAMVLTLSNPSSSAITVSVATADGTASSADYTAVAPTTVTFAAGETTKTVNVDVKGDVLDEANETFVLNLSSPSGATIADNQATGTITDDDATPTLSVNDVTVTEGNSGTTTATFTVTLSAVSGRTVTVAYSTVNGTATGEDYTTASGTATIAAGSTTATVGVPVKGDTVDEDNESFSLVLSSPTNATVADASGTGTITDDDTASAAPAPGSGQGYSLVGEDGSLYTFGTAKNLGDMRGTRLNAPIISVQYTPGGNGYWLVARDGGIFTFGDAEFFGSTGSLTLAAPVIGMASTPSGRGYWLFASDGGIFTFGDAQFYGSMGGQKLNAPVINMEPVESGTGYWLVAADGGIFTFGTAQFFGSMGDQKINQPVFDMTSTDTDNGYWLVARDGGIFSFGDAAPKFYGSAVNETPRPTKVIGMDSTPGSLGYWIADANGKVYPYGNAQSLGDRYLAANPAPMIGFSSVPGVKPGT